MYRSVHCYDFEGFVAGYGNWTPRRPDALALADEEQDEHEALIPTWIERR